MKAISRRLTRLEERLVPKNGLQTWPRYSGNGFAALMHSGQSHVAEQPDLSERGLNLAEILRMRRERRVNASGQTGTAGDRAHEALG